MGASIRKELIDFDPFNNLRDHRSTIYLLEKQEEYDT